MYVDDFFIPRLAGRGVRVVDMRETLPYNTLYPRVKKWDTRPVSAISLVAVHYDAVPARPELFYDAEERYRAEARAHINADWGGGYHAPTIAYHLKIDGQPGEALASVYVLNDFENITWNANEANGQDVAVCVDLGEGQNPLTGQLAALQEVLDVLNEESPQLPCWQGTTYGHGELKSYGNATACPGTLLASVALYRATGSLGTAPPAPIQEEDMGIIDELNRQIAELRETIAARDSEIGSLREDTIKPLRAELAALKDQQPPAPEPPAEIERVSVVTRVYRTDGTMVTVPGGFEARP